MAIEDIEEEEPDGRSGLWMFALLGWVGCAVCGYLAFQQSH